MHGVMGHSQNSEGKTERGSSQFLLWTPKEQHQVNVETEKEGTSVICIVLPTMLDTLAKEKEQVQIQKQVKARRETWNWNINCV